MGTLTKNEKKLTRPFNFTFLYIDDVLSINNSKFGDYADLIYATGLEVNNATDTGCSALYASVSEVFMIKNVYLGFFDKQGSHTDGYKKIMHIVNTFRVTHSSNEDLHNIKRKGDPKSRYH
jgi:hypothetical protein